MSDREFTLVLVFVICFFILTVGILVRWQLDLIKQAKYVVALITRQDAEKAAWERERGKLLDRIMAQDLTEYKTMEHVEKASQVELPPVMTDAIEARMEREARGEK